MKKRKFISLAFALVMVMSMCACKKEPEIPDCSPLTSYFLGNNANELISQIRSDAGKMEKDEEQTERRTYLRNLREIPFPANVPFTYTPVDHGIGFHAIELTIQPYSRDHVCVEYRYPGATYPFVNSLGESVAYNGSVFYSFYRVLIHNNRILQSVGEYYETCYSENQGADHAEMIDGNLYIRGTTSVQLYFDLNPGIGMVWLGSKFPEQTDIPYEELLPFCQWELIPMDSYEQVTDTDHVGWW